jgi:hypothetical protein
MASGLLVRGCRRLVRAMSRIRVVAQVSFHSVHDSAHDDCSAHSRSPSRATPGVECSLDSTLRLDHDNEPQPDLLLRIAPEHATFRDRLAR